MKSRQHWSEPLVYSTKPSKGVRHAHQGELLHPHVGNYGGQLAAPELTP